MATLKKKVTDIKEDTETLVKDYLKLFAVSQSQKLVLLLGILATIFVIILLILIVLLFCSFALAEYLNEIISGDYWGILIVAGSYILLILLIVVRTISTGKPLFANLFVKIVTSVLSIDFEQPKSLDGLENEKRNLDQQIETDKIKIRANFEMLRYALMESLFKEFLGLFTIRKKSNKTEASDVRGKAKSKTRK